MKREENGIKALIYSCKWWKGFFGMSPDTHTLRGWKLIFSSTHHALSNFNLISFATVHFFSSPLMFSLTFLFRFLQLLFFQACFTCSACRWDQGVELVWVLKVVGSLTAILIWIFNIPFVKSHSQLVFQHFHWGSTQTSAVQNKTYPCSSCLLLIENVFLDQLVPLTFYAKCIENINK